VSWFKFGFGKSKKTQDAAQPALDAEAPEESASSLEQADTEQGSAHQTPQAQPAEPVEDYASAAEPAPAIADAQDVQDDVSPQADEIVEGPVLQEQSVLSEKAPEQTPSTENVPVAVVEDEDRAAETGAEKSGFFARLARGLRKSSSRLSEGLSTLFTKRKLDQDALDDLEELLIAADIGAVTAAKVIDTLAKDRFDKDVTDLEIREALAQVVAETLQPYEQPLDMTGDAPRVVLFVGVNGSGKTTTLGKIAVKMTREGADVVTAAGDTFRAAAVEQLQVWSERAGAKFLSRDLGADAAGLAFDAIQQGRDEQADAVLIDTAGRLQNKAELMDELRKIVRVIKKIDDTAPHHVLLVLDGTVGSNALSQAEAFLEASDVTGVIMTKLDGTAKGGALVQVAEKFKLPIHFIGVGEGEADLQAFIARDFARALAGLED